MYDALWLVKVMYDALWLVEVMYDALWLAQMMYDALWLVEVEANDAFQRVLDELPAAKTLGQAQKDEISTSMNKKLLRGGLELEHHQKQQQQGQLTLGPWVKILKIFKECRHSRTIPMIFIRVFHESLRHLKIKNTLAGFRDVMISIFASRRGVSNKWLRCWGPRFTRLYLAARMYIAVWFLPAKRWFKMHQVCRRFFAIFLKAFGFIW